MRGKQTPLISSNKNLTKEGGGTKCLQYSIGDLMPQISKMICTTVGLPVSMTDIERWMSCQDFPYATDDIRNSATLWFFDQHPCPKNASFAGS
ncbi:hypothetical protein SESBI_26252 [Sesbania bispinosa]|nr:hypothetical protein SESBI_26252 [Sesbania bispinosa]